MQAFEYAHPASVKEALGLLGSSWEDAQVIAGGTDLISLMKDNVAAPKRVINIKGIPELNGIRSGAEGMTIGALVTYDELIENASVKREFPGLVQAVDDIASTQIRNMGTVGGGLCQRPRCWYFRNGFGLLATDKNGKSLVPNGENQYHAILGNDGPAYYVHPSSLAPALIALDAKVRLMGPNGPREMRVGEFFQIPKSASEREIVLQPNEIVKDILIPASSRGFQSASYEVRQKLTFDWPLATAAVAVKMNAGKVSDARIVLGHVAPVPWPAPEAAKGLIGRPLNETNAAAAGIAALAGAKPLSKNGYKIKLAQVAVKRALLRVGGGPSEKGAE